jgi:hypothetical protein
MQFKSPPPAWVSVKDWTREDILYHLEMIDQVARNGDSTDGLRNYLMIYLDAIRKELETIKAATKPTTLEKSCP